MPGRIVGKVVSADASGNLVTDITADRLKAVPRDESVTVRCDDHVTNGIFTADHSEPDFTLLAMIGGSERLELVIVGDSARVMLGVAIGQEVEIQW